MYIIFYTSQSPPTGILPSFQTCRQIILVNWSFKGKKKILVSLVSCRKLLTAENKEMPTGVLSGCRQICLTVVGVQNKARLLTHLHVSLACLQLPKSLCIFADFFLLFFAHKYKLRHTLLTTICTGRVDTAHLEGPHVYHGGFTLKGCGLDRDG